jgi:hypothetical protein
MRRRYVLIALAAVAALASTASLLAGLRHALRREHAPDARSDIERIRDALGPRVGKIDPNDFPEYLRRDDDPRDTDAIRASITPIDRPAWKDIREDRDARG